MVIIREHRMTVTFEMDGEYTVPDTLGLMQRQRVAAKFGAKEEKKNTEK